MADSSAVQASFLGGEWSPLAQGRIDLADYRRALQVCLNAIPLQEGAWTRRGGWFRAGATRQGAQAIVRPFLFPDNTPGYLELSYLSGASYLRFWIANAAKTAFVRMTDDTRTVSAISTANPAAVTVSATETWSTGDPVIFSLDPATAIGPASALEHQREFTITKVDTTHFTIADALTGSGVSGALSYTRSANDKVSRVLTIPLPYTSLADLLAVNVVKADSLALLLHKNYKPQALYWNGTTFSLTDGAGMANWDGPYLDPFLGNQESQQGVSSGVVDSWSPPATFTISDGSYTFTAGDVGKPIRLWSQPPAWDATHDYNHEYIVLMLGRPYVTYQGAFWAFSLLGSAQNPNSAGVAPGSSYTFTDNGRTVTVVPWAPAPQAGNWNVGTITSYISGSSVGISIPSPVFYPTYGTYLTCDIWQIAFFGGSQYPACGAYHEGRLLFGGASPNRFDASVSDALDTFKVKNAGGIVPAGSFSGSDHNGNVGDANAFSSVLNDDELNNILWFAPGAAGITAGTPGGEFLIQASAMNDPLTPSTVQAHKVSKFKCSVAEPLRVGAVVLFIQAFGRRVMEYFADAFSRALTARHLNEYAGHLAQPGLAEIRYQEERSPIVWTRRNDNVLTGCTYRRVSQFAAEAPVFAGWHEHTHGYGNAIESICVGPSPAGTIDCLVASTKGASYRFVEFMAPVFEESFLLPQAMHVDSAFAASGTEAGGSSIVFYGLTAYAGATASVWLAGLDCGDYTVSASGTVTVPYGADPDALLTAAYLKSVSDAPPSGGWPYVAPVDVTIAASLTRVNVPVAIGATFTSKGQTLPDMTQETSRTPNGPSEGETRRGHMYSMLAVNTIGASLTATAGLTIGGDFTNQRAVTFRASSNDDTLLSTVQMKTGWHQDILDDTYAIDSSLCWQMTRPYPATIAAIGTFANTQER